MWNAIKTWIINTVNNKIVRRYVVSSIVTFVAGFAIVFVKDIDSLTLSSFKDGTFIGLVFLAVRAGLKALLEGILFWVNSRKNTETNG